MVLAGAIVGLFLLLGFHLLGTGLRNPRWLLVGVLVIAALYMYGQQQLANDIKNIGLTAGPSSNCVGNQVQVVIRNERADKIVAFGFSLRGYQPNHSQHVVFAALDTDRIVPAGQSWASCWDIENLSDVPVNQHASLRWEAELTSVDFEP